MSKPGVVAVIPAAGSGIRVGGGLPKQYRQLAGRPVVAHTLRALATDPRIRALVLVEAVQNRWQANPEAEFGVPLLCCAGGASRAESVLAGLEAGRGAGVSHVLVHDAVRPCLHPEDLSRVLDAGLASPDGALLARPVAETVKRGLDAVEATLDREGLWLAQTPQVFVLEALESALRAVLGEGRGVTDESAAMEMAGAHPKLVRALHPNPKITWPEDLLLAESLLATNREVHTS